jgi:hypothetical protein
MEVVVSFTLLTLYPRERAQGTHCIGGWVDPRAGLDDVKKRKVLILPGLELRLLGSSSPQPVAIPTELSRFPGWVIISIIIYTYGCVTDVVKVGY